MNSKTIITLGILIVYLFGMIAMVSAIVVDSEYVVFYAGDEKRVQLEIENNEDFDMEDISVALDLTDVPFTAVGSSEKDVDDIDDDDDDDVSFTLRASTDVVPSDYDIPYTIKYTNADTDETENKTGTFSVRVSAETNLDFVVEAKGDSADSAIVGQQGKVSLRIINQGLGEVKFVSVQVSTGGFELTSSDKVYIGTIDSDDSDTASFDGIFKSTAATLTAIVTYKDFDNNDQTETISLPIKVYSQEKALELGLISKPNYVPYLIGGIVLIAWLIWRRIKKARKKRAGRN